jgi:hypothetical protein
MHLYAVVVSTYRQKEEHYATGAPLVHRDSRDGVGGSRLGAKSVHVNQPSLVGTAKITERKDADGKEYGKEFLAKATEDGFNEVTYRFPRPGETVQVEKSSFVTKVGDVLCGVGYYK